MSYTTIVRVLCNLFAILSTAAILTMLALGEVRASAMLTLLIVLISVAAIEFLLKREKTS